MFESSIFLGYVEVLNEHTVVTIPDRGTVSTRWGRERQGTETATLGEYPS